MDPMLSKRSFERHVTKAIKKCQIEDNEGNANKSASADADERNLLSPFTEEEMKEEHRLVTKVTTPVSLSKKLPDFGNWT